MDAIEKAVAKSSKGNKAQKLRSATQNMASREKAVLTRKPAVNFGNKGMVASNTVFNAPGVSSKSRRRPKAKPQSRLFTLPYKSVINYQKNIAL